MNKEKERTLRILGTRWLALIAMARELCPDLRLQLFWNVTLQGNKQIEEIISLHSTVTFISQVF